MKRVPLNRTVLLLCGLFLGAGSLWLDLQGIQADEALFANSMYGEGDPLMLMSYLGALKSWLYRPIFALWPPSAASLRLPVLLAGALTIGLVFVLLRGVSGVRAGLIAAALLATDATFLFTTRCDWGPVALQHLLLVGAVFLIWRFSQDQRMLSLAAGFFLLGLALWDKATTAWLLAGLGLALLITNWSAIRRLFTPGRAAVAVLAFVLGAFPLLRYNLDNGWATWAETGNFSIASVPDKIPALWRNVQGDALFGYLMRDPPVAQVAEPEGWAQRASVGITLWLGEPRANWHGWLLITAVVLAIAVARSRAAAFFGLGSLFTWVLMAATEGGGMAPHHLVLLWPWPHAFAAATLGRAADRFGRPTFVVAAIAVTLVAGRGLAVINHHYAQLIRYGAAPPWSESIYELHDALRKSGATEVWAGDWGISEPILLLSEGRIRVRRVYEPILNPEHGDEMLQEAFQPDRPIVVHAPPYEAFEAINGKLAEAAAPHGGRLEVAREFRDRQGMATFRILQFEPPGGLLQEDGNAGLGLGVADVE